MKRAELERVPGVGLAEVGHGARTPVGRYQYMKLREALDAILAGMDCVKPPDSPELEQHSGKHLRLVANTGSRESVRPRPTGEPVRLPM